MARYKSKAQRHSRYVGLVALLSVVLYAMGMPMWWAPITADKDPRELVLFLLHFCGIIALVVSCINDMWEHDDA